MYVWPCLCVRYLLTAIYDQCSSTGESATGTPYVNEYMLIIHFVPPKEGGDGLPKMSLVKEFVDSATAVKFFTDERAKVAKATAAAQTRVNE